MVSGSIQQCFLTLFFHLSHISSLPASTTRPMQACTVQRTCTFACIHLPATSAWTNIQKYRSFRCSLRYRSPPHTYIRQVVTETRHTCKESLLRGFSQSLLTSTFFNLLTRTYICSHIHTQSTNSDSRTPSTSTQRETTWTKRSGFTLLEELEPLRVETEENYNI